MMAKHLEQTRTITTRVLRIGTCLLAAWALSCAAGEDTNVQQRRIGPDKQTDSYRWIMTTPSGVNFTLAQRVPDQTRSFYIARGFSQKAANQYAVSCVFQTIVHNDSRKAMSFDLSDWRVIFDGRERPIRSTAQWQEQWETIGVPKSARIAFQWSQFPTVQKHDPGDWFQGMIAAGLPPQSTFALKIVWREDDTRHEAVMTDLVCPKDRVLER